MASTSTVSSLAFSDMTANSQDPDTSVVTGTPGVPFVPGTPATAETSEISQAPGTSAITEVSTSTETDSTSNFLPLTTIFTPPPNCADHVWTDFVYYGLYYVLIASPRRTCLPPQPTLAAGNSAVIWSPGVCPSGYSASEFTVDRFRSTGPVVTTCYCCMSDAFYDIHSQSCAINMGQTVTAVVNDSTTTFTATSTEQIQGYIAAVTIEWAEDDLSLFTPASAPLLQFGVTSTSFSASGTSLPSLTISSASSNASNTTPPTATSISSPPRTLDRSALNIGQRIGVGVGVGCGALFLLVCVSFLVFRRWYRRGGSNSTDLPPSFEAPEAVDPYADTRTVHEAGGRQIPVEGDFMNVKHELEGGWQGQEIEAAGRDRRETGAEKRDSERGRNGERHGDELPAGGGSTNS